ncbi:MAG: TerB family tellurite resistance protein [Sphingobacterium sp.]
MSMICRIVLLICFTCSGNGLWAQTTEVGQLLLNVEKLAQLKGILSQMKQGYRILYKGYNAVRDVSQGNFSLHKIFLDGLLKVSPGVRDYARIPEIIRAQIKLMQGYRQAYQRFHLSGYFEPSELVYLTRVYGNLVQLSLRGLEELTLVITAGSLRMNDQQRLQRVDRIFNQAEDILVFLRNFNAQNDILLIQRMKEENNLRATQSLYQVQP